MSFGKLYLFGMVFTQLSLWLMAKLDTDEKKEGKVRFPFIYGFDKIELIAVCLVTDAMFGLIIAQVLDLAQIGGL